MQRRKLRVCTIYVFFFSRVKYAGVSAFAGCKLGNLKVGAESVFWFFFCFIKVGCGKQVSTGDCRCFLGEATDSNIRPSPGPLSNTAGGSQATNNDGILWSNHNWLVVSTPLKKNKPVGIIIPNIWKNKTCSKPPTKHVMLVGYSTYIS